MPSSQTTGPCADDWYRGDPSCQTLLVSAGRTAGILRSDEGGDSPMTSHYHDEHYVERPTEPEGSGLVGYAAIKYTAIVVIVLAILAFLAWYVIPRIG